MFVQRPGEPFDAMFAHFDGVVSNIRSTGVLPYSNHERAIKLLYALDRSIWEVKISSIEESPSYDMLTCDELFSKLKSIEIAKAAWIGLRNPLSQNIALVFGPGGGNQFVAGFSNANTLLSESKGFTRCLIALTKQAVDGAALSVHVAGKPASVNLASVRDLSRRGKSCQGSQPSAVKVCLAGPLATTVRERC